ncbi:MAG TPA: hypothetical protein VMT04_04370, partial [Terriglobales bacterium]|nr:hypothetical protein [Terriglobales bacterium]
MHKKYLVLFLAVISALIWFGSAFPQDPGVPDTVSVECLDKVRPNSQVVLNVYITNDEHLGTFTIPLVFPDTTSNLDITLDSVRFSGTRASTATLVTDPSSIDNAKNRVVVYAIWFAGDLAPG